MRARIPGSMPASTVGHAPSRSSPAIGLSFARLRRSPKSRTSSRARSRMRAPCSVMRTVRPDAHDQRHADLALQRVDLL